MRIIINCVVVELISMTSTLLGVVMRIANSPPLTFAINLSFSVCCKLINFCVAKNMPVSLHVCASMSLA